MTVDWAVFFVAMYIASTRLVDLLPEVPDGTIGVNATDKHPGFAVLRIDSEDLSQSRWSTRPGDCNEVVTLEKLKAPWRPNECGFSGLRAPFHAAIVIMPLFSAWQTRSQGRRYPLVMAS